MLEMYCYLIICMNYYSSKVLGEKIVINVLNIKISS